MIIFEHDTKIKVDRLDYVKECLQFNCSKNLTMKANDLNNHFTKANIHTSSKHVERYSTSLKIREMWIETLMKYHLPPIRMAVIKTTNQTGAQKITMLLRMSSN